MVVSDRKIVEKRAKNRVDSVRNAKAPKDATVENKAYSFMRGYVEEIILKEK